VEIAATGESCPGKEVKSSAAIVEPAPREAGKRKSAEACPIAEKPAEGTVGPLPSEFFFLFITYFEVGRKDVPNRGRLRGGGGIGTISGRKARGAMGVPSMKSDGRGKLVVKA